MISVILFSSFIAIIIYCIIVIRLKSSKNATWYKVGLSVTAWLLFMFIFFESVTYMEQGHDYRALNRFEKVRNELAEKERLAGTVLSFVISKKNDKNAVDIDAEKYYTADEFFKDYPNLISEEINNTLNDFLEIKNKREEMDKKIGIKEQKMLSRAKNPWIFILPNN